MESLEERALLAMVTVDTTTDENDGDTSSIANLIGAPGGTGISLREAIIAANNTMGPDDITLPSGTYTLTITGELEDGGTTGDLDIADDVTITGDGAGTTIVQAGTNNTNGIDRVFDVIGTSTLPSTSTVTVVLDGMTIRYGRPDAGTLITNVGGGVAMRAATGLKHVTIQNSVITENYSDSANGGGINAATNINDVVAAQLSTLVLDNTEVSNNTADLNGGGIFASNITLSITGGELSGNQGLTGGGGIGLSGDDTDVDITSSTITGNSATGDGGGVATQIGNPTVDIHFSRIVSNSATGNGDALSNGGGGTFNAENNWFGANTGPAAGAINGTIDVDPWLVLTHTASPDSINTGAMTTLTAALTENSNGVDTSGMGTVPDDIPILFDNEVLGTLSGAETVLSSGTATATYTAGVVSGVGSADATIDSQTVAAMITIIGGLVVDFAAGDLSITDPAGGSDDLTTQFNSTTNEIILLDPNNSLDASAIAGLGVTDTPGQVIIDLDDITFGPINTITFEAGAGNDTLTVDHSLGVNPIPITYNGGAGATDNDQLIVTGNTFQTAIHNFTSTGPENSGNLLYDETGDGSTPESTINYTGLEPVDMTGSTITDLVFNLPGADDQAILEDDIGGAGNMISQIRSQNAVPTFDTTTFADPGGSLTVNMGGDNGVLDIAALPDFTAALIVDGEGNTNATGDTINFNASLTLGAGTVTGNLTATAETINLKAASLATDGGTNAGSVEFNGAVVLGAATVTIDTDSAAGTDGDVTFNGTVDSDGTNRSLVVNTDGGSTQFVGDVGGGGAGAELASLTTDAGAGITRIDANVTTTGNQTYNDAVEINPDGNAAGTTRLDAHNATITFQQTLRGTNDGEDSLILAANNMDFVGAVGDNSQRLVNLTIDDVNEDGATQVVADVDFQSAVTLTGNLVQDGGTGTTTFNGGTIGGLLDVTTSDVVFNSGTTTVTGTVTIAAANAITSNADDGVADVTGTTFQLSAGAGGIGTTTDHLDVTASTRFNADTSAAGSDVFVDSIGILPLGVVNADTGTVVLTSTTKITDGDTGNENANVVAGSAALRAQTGIGSGVSGAGDIDTTVSSLAATTVTGDLNVRNVGALDLTSVNGLGEVSITAGAVGDDLTVVAASPLTVSVAVSNAGGGDILLAAEGNVNGTVGAFDAADDDLQVNAGVTATGGDGSIALFAGGDVLQATGTTISVVGAGNVNVSAGEDYNAGSNQAGNATADVLMAGTASVTADTATIEIEATRHVALTSVTANATITSTVTVSADDDDFSLADGTGAITDNLTGEGSGNENVIARNVLLFAGSGIGSGTGVLGEDADIDIRGTELAAVNTTSGSVQIAETDGIRLRDGGTNDAVYNGASTDGRTVVIDAGTFITDDTGTETTANITATNAVLRAGGNIGTTGSDAQDLDLDAANVAATTATGDISLQDSGGLSTFFSDATGTANDVAGISITDSAATGHILVRDVAGVLTIATGAGVTNAGTGTTTLAADTGDLLVDDDVANTNANGGDVRLIAFGDVVFADMVVLSTNGGDAEVHAGRQYVFGANGGGSLSAMDQQASDVTASGTTYAILVDGPINDGDVLVTAGRHIDLATISAGTGTVFLTADITGSGNGYIDDLSGDAANDVTAANAAFRAGGQAGAVGDARIGIGQDSNDLNLTISGNFAAATGNGDVNVFNNGPLTIGTVSGVTFGIGGNTFSGELSGVIITDARPPLTGADNTDDVGGPDSGLDNITLIAASPLTVDSPIFNQDGGDITLTAPGTGDVTINADVQVTGDVAGADDDGQILVTATTGSIVHNTGTVSTVGGNNANTSGQIVYNATNTAATGDGGFVRIGDVNAGNDAAEIITVNGNVEVDADRGTPGAAVTIADSGTDALVSTTSGNITIDGTAAGMAGTTANYGVLVDDGSTIESTGSTMVGTITLNGTGGLGSSFNNGVRLSGTQVTTADGDLVIRGSASATATGNDNDGVFIGGGADVVTTATGAIDIDGTGGGGASFNRGVQIEGNGTTVEAQGDGGISIDGTAIDTTTGSLNTGVSIQDEAVVSSSGSGAIDIDGTGGGGTLVNGGVLLSDDAAISVVDGDLTIDGTGGEAPDVPAGSIGILLQDGIVSSTGTGTDAGRIVLQGTGSATGVGGGNNGVRLITSTVTSEDGGILFVGTGRGADSNSPGISLESSKVLSTGKANITLVGEDTTNNTNIGIQLFSSTVGDADVPQNADDNTGFVILDSGTDTLFVTDSTVRTTGDGSSTVNTTARIILSADRIELDPANTLIQGLTKNGGTAEIVAAPDSGDTVAIELGSGADDANGFALTDGELDTLEAPVIRIGVTDITRGDQSETVTSNLQLLEGGNSATAATTFENLDNPNGDPFVDGDVIEITGNGVVGTVNFTITNVCYDTLGDLLTAISAAYDGATATIVNGVITLTADTPGDVAIDFTLDLASAAGNTGNTNSDPLGVFSVTTQGTNSATASILNQFDANVIAGAAPLPAADVDVIDGLLKDAASPYASATTSDIDVTGNFTAAADFATRLLQYNTTGDVTITGDLDLTGTTNLGRNFQVNATNITQTGQVTTSSVLAAADDDDVNSEAELDGDVLYFATRSIGIFGGGIQTVNGEISLFGNRTLTAQMGAFTGVTINNADIVTGFGDVDVDDDVFGGNIVIEGSGGAAGGTSRGVEITLSATVQSRGTEESVERGTITIAGTGTGTNMNDGLGVAALLGASISSVDGDITIAGTGANGSTRGAGVLIQESTVRSMGGDGDAANITIDGTGGSGADDNDGVALIDAFGTPMITTAAGGTADITIRGTSGTVGAGFGNNGFQIFNGEIVANGTGNVILLGTGGVGSGQNEGVVASGATASIRTTTGSITIAGRSRGTGANNEGVEIAGGATVTTDGGAIGTGGAIDIDGIGRGENDNEGVLITGGAVVSTISSGGMATGSITIDGTSLGTMADNEGVEISAGADVTVADDGGTITIVGTAGDLDCGVQPTDDSEGVLITGMGTSVTTTNGTIDVTGQSFGTGDQNEGVDIGGSTAAATPSGGVLIETTSGDINVDGTGRGTDDNEGVLIQGGTYSSNDVPLSIPDTGTIASSLTVTVPSNDTFDDLNVQLDIDHPFDGSLNVVLIAPNGTMIELFTGVGNGGANFDQTLLDDEATTPITSGTAPFAGTFQPEQALSALDGIDPRGTWTLEITDTGGGNTGVLNSWSLFFGNSSAVAVRTQSGSITIDGTGLGTGDANAGVGVSGAVVEATTTGTIEIDGTGGTPGAGIDNEGVRVDFAARISAATTGTVTIDGTGRGTDENEGVNIGESSTVNSVDGSITINGTSLGTGTDNHGVEIDTDAVIETTGVGTGNGNISITGSGGGNGNGNGVRLFSGPLVRAVDGDIAITGTTTATGSDNEGVEIFGLANIATTGVGAGNGDITITGTGAGDDSNEGVDIDGQSVVTTVDGSVTVLGSSLGTGTDNNGVEIDGGALIRTLGIGDVSIDGTGSAAGTDENRGVLIAGSVNDTRELIANGGFEFGDFSGWTVQNVSTSAGGWTINDGSVDSFGSPVLPVTVIHGSFDAVSQQSGAGQRILSQTITLPANVTFAQLAWLDRILNPGGTFSDPTTEFRVLLDGNTVFSTNPGDPPIQNGPNARTFDVTALAQSLAGQMVQLQFVEQDSASIFNVALDNVSLLVRGDYPTEVSTGAGNININGAAGGATTDDVLLDEAKIHSATGDITLTGNHADSRMQNGSLISTGEGTVHVRAANDIFVEQVNLNDDGGAAGSGIFQADFDVDDGDLRDGVGAIIDNRTGDGAGNLNIFGGPTILDAATGIGAADAIDMTVGQLDIVNTTSGDVNVDHFGALTLIDLNSDGFSVNNAGGGLIRALSPLEVASDAVIGGAMTLRAAESAAAGDDLTVLAGVNITGAGSLSLEAGDNITLEETSMVMVNGVLTIEGDNPNFADGAPISDPAGTVINILGANGVVGGLGGTSILGGAEMDTFNIQGERLKAGAAAVVEGRGGDDQFLLRLLANSLISPAAGTALRIDGGTGGNTLKIDTSADTVERTVTFYHDDPSGRFTQLDGLGAPGLIDLDNLDAYRVLAGAAVGDHLQVIGINAPSPAGDDVITVGNDGSGVRYQVVGGVDCLHLVGRQGNDLITNNTSIVSLIEGGDGDDLLTGGDGLDVIFGGAGVDQLYGRGDSDFLFADLDLNGNVLPADNELVDGGPGYDRAFAISTDGEPAHRDTVLNVAEGELLQEVDQLVFIPWGSPEERFVFPTAQDIEGLRQLALTTLAAYGCDLAPRVLPSENLGMIESVARNDLNLAANGQFLFSFTATYSGTLTAEANHTAGGVQLYLFDAGVNEVGRSLTGMNPERIDVNAAAGATYYLLVVGDSPDVDLSLVNMVTQNSPLTVHGTAGDDVFEFYGGDGLHFSVNGVRYDYTLAESTSVTFLGGGGNDSIRVVRSNDAEDIAVAPTWVALTHPDYVMQAVDVESIEVVGAFRQAPLQNSSNSADVNNDGVVNFGDVLDTISALRNTAAGEAMSSSEATMFYDVNGDTHLNFGDILAIISVLRDGTAGGEGEASSLATSSPTSEAWLSTSDQTVYTADTTVATSTDTVAGFTVSAISDTSPAPRIETESESQLAASSVTSASGSVDSSILIGSSPPSSTQEDDADQTTLEEENPLAADSYFLRLGQYDRLSSEELDREDGTLVSDLDPLDGSSPDAEEFAALLDDVAREWFD